MPDTPRVPHDITELMLDLGARARRAARALASAPAAAKHAALNAMAGQVRAAAPEILAANAADIAAMTANGRAASFIDRGTLDPARVEAIAVALEEIAALPDPVGRVLAAWTRPNGLSIERVATPLGVIGIIFESRPNVTADAGALCLKAGNAAILRCGSDTLASAGAIAAALRRGLARAGLPEDAIQLVPVADRAAVGAMLTGLGGAIDVIVPRGGKSLVARVQDEARVPVFAHLEGICHVYIHEKADLEMAVAVTVNAKLRRTGVCGSAETLLVDETIAGSHLRPILAALQAKGCEIRGDRAVCAAFPAAVAASEEDWSSEYLDSIISVKLVKDIDEAIRHIETYGSHHTESIVTADEEAARRFLAEVDSAIVLHNASTQFADGGEFGMGAEIGIATGRMHARGPVGVEQLTSFKYRVHGNGQLRP